MIGSAWKVLRYSPVAFLLLLFLLQITQTLPQHGSVMYEVKSHPEEVPRRLPKPASREA